MYPDIHIYKCAYSSNANKFLYRAMRSYLRILILKLYVRLRTERVVDMPRGHLHLYISNLLLLPPPFKPFRNLLSSL